DATVVRVPVELESLDGVAMFCNTMHATKVWDDELGFLLGPAVFAYEQERICGASFGGDDFQDAVQLCVPQRHCFKGYPACFDHASCGKVMSSLLTRTVALDILSSTGDHLR
ncbi:unnamed protein product, partial [Hapterophycus canaliculatus]